MNNHINALPAFSMDGLESSRPIHQKISKESQIVVGSCGYVGKSNVELVGKGLIKGGTFFSVAFVPATLYQCFIHSSANVATLFVHISTGQIKQGFFLNLASGGIAEIKECSCKRECSSYSFIFVHLFLLARGPGRHFLTPLFVGRSCLLSNKFITQAVRVNSPPWRSFF